MSRHAAAVMATAGDAHPLPSTRRTLVTTGLAGLAAAGAMVTADRLAGSDAQDWADFRRRFVTPEGRVLDTGNRNVSHTEGQGYAMLAAVRAGDRSGFHRLLTWTLENLRRPQSELFAWRYVPDSFPPVLDQNNASDGDLAIAWALLVAGDRWRIQEYYQQALATARELQQRCFIEVAGRWLFLPGSHGFRNNGRVVVNLSYYILPALQALGEALNDPTWVRVEADGLALMSGARFGRHNLPPDWLELTLDGRAMAPARNWPARFSFDAVRIPLHLCWGGSAAHPLVDACVDYWTRPPGRHIPAWVGLEDGQEAPYLANAGMLAVVRLAHAAHEPGQHVQHALPQVNAGADYYAAALAMLARMAWRELRLG